MDADGLWIGQTQRAERLAALDKQRMLLEGLHEDIGISIRQVASMERSSRWRSPAEALFASHRDQLRRDLWAAQQQLGDALDAVIRAIAEAGE